MTNTDRQRIREITRAVAEDNARRLSFAQQILEAVSHGPVTRRECLALVKPTANTIERKAFNDALSRMMRTGKVRERPMIPPAGRAVRVEPVMVLEVVP
jgi:hypothetical protein